ncbi:hypothetical protein BLA29_008427, partial [Euroglyphus maynei]
STLLEQHCQLDPLVDNLKFLENGIRQGRKKFSFSDLMIQLYRTIKIAFVAEYRNFLMQFAFFFILITMLSMFYETKMTHANPCYSLESDENSFNLTCREKLYDEALTDDYRMHQMFEFLLTSVSIIGMSSLFFHPLLKVFRNEHRNQWYSLGTFYWAFMIVRFIEINLLTCFIEMVSYFSIDHLYVDNNSLNWYRFGNYLYFFWINNCYQQSIGQLLCLIFLDRIEVSIVSSYIVVICQQFFTGYLFNPYKMKAFTRIILRISEVLSIKTIPNGLMYTMYGLDRCEDET